MLKFILPLVVALFTSVISAHPLDDILDVNAMRRTPGLLRLFTADAGVKQNALETMIAMSKAVQGCLLTNQRTAEEIFAGVQKRMEAELGHLTTLAEAVSAHKADCPWNLKSDKMAFQLRQLLGQPGKGETLLGGHTLLTRDNVARFMVGNLVLLDGAQELDPGLIHFPNVLEAAPTTPNFWGTTRGTQAELLMLFTTAEVIGTNTVEHTLTQAGVSIEDTAIAHPVLVPVPVTEQTAGDGALINSFFHGTSHGHRFTTIHTGFLFGGHTGDSLYPTAKPVGPWDCSSYVEAMHGGDAKNAATSTFYHAYLYMSVTDPTMYAQKLADFDAGARSDVEKNVARLGQLFEVVPSHEELHLGDIIGWRRGGGGHVGVFAGHTKDGTGFGIMGTNRGLTADMREGVGIEVVKHTPIQPQESITYYFLRPKQ